MIEIRRDLYLDEAMGTAHGGMEGMIEAMGKVVGRIREAALVAQARPLGIDAGKRLRSEEEGLELEK